MFVFSEPFLTPVDPEALNIPTYRSIITRPMDLGTIKRMINKKEIITADEITKLVCRTFVNAMIFNPEVFLCFVSTFSISFSFESN